MQTRRVSKAAAVVAASATPNSPRATSSRSASVAAVTPSPPRKKLKARRSMATPAPASKFDAIDSIRDEMRSLVLSRVAAAGGKSSGNNIVDTHTLGGWCLVDGLAHCAIASNGILLPFIKDHGPPSFYVDHIKKKNGNNAVVDSGENATHGDGYRSFRSLCRIVSGQQLAGNAAKTIWRRLLNVADATEENPSKLSPERILSIVECGDVEVNLRCPAGLSNAKCNCIIAIAKSFREGTLSDDILLGGGATDDEVRSTLLGIKGLGPWSVDMFLLFQCHRSNVLPIGDLAFRNGTSNLWGVRGHAKGGGLCQKKDERMMKELHEAFAPYRSISSYYMYNCSGMKG